MKKIALVESKAGFQQRSLERFVQDNLPNTFQRPNNISGMGDFAKHYKEIENCAAETPVNGTVEIFFETAGPEAIRRLSIPVMSRFFVYCTRDEADEYKVAWIGSLS